MSETSNARPGAGRRGPDAPLPEVGEEVLPRLTGHADDEEWEIAPRPARRRAAPPSPARPRAVPATAPAAQAEAVANPALLASIFLFVATLLLGWNTPLQIGFHPQPAATVVLIVLAGGLLAWGTLRSQRPALLGGVAALLALDVACLTTQPIQFGTSLAAAWAIRVALVSLIAIAWALLMDPPTWLRRGLVAVGVPTAALLVVVGGPSVVAQVTGSTLPGNSGFSPYWLAVDSHGTVYASSATGNEILVYGSTGNPAGTLWPSRAPAPGTPGPGIIPAGYEAEIGISNTTTLSTTQPTDPDLLSGFYFCGLAVDGQDNLYVIDSSNPTGAKLLRFDSGGNITARWSMPRDFRPAVGCLAADATHVYLSSAFGQVYVLDLAGQIQQQIKLNYSPFGIAAARPDQVIVLGHNFLDYLDIRSGTGVTTTLPPPTGVLETPYQTLAASVDGQALVTDITRNQILRMDAHGKIAGTIGEPGSWPGQFRAPGGLARDRAGQIYLADWQHRIIQRFSPDGQVNAVWWALELGEERKSVLPGKPR